MDLKELSKYGQGAFQFVPPRCYELRGETFELLMDDGFDLVLKFTSGTDVQWHYINKEPTAPQHATYECLKGDDTTYLVTWNCEGFDMAHRVNFTFIIDLEQHLVTHLIGTIGRNPRWPYLLDTDFVFGCIKQEGVAYKHYPRHGFSDEMMGNVVKWQYSPSMATVHVYHNPNWYRISYPRDKDTPQVTSSLGDIMKELPSSDEPCRYVKIKEGMYLVSLTEQNMEKILGDKMGFRSNTLCFLDNYKNSYNVGRGFGTMTTKNEDGTTTDGPIFVMIGAYGTIIDPKEDEFWQNMLDDKIPYIV